jgi:hypothetical protein
MIQQGAYFLANDRMLDMAIPFLQEVKWEMWGKRTGRSSAHDVPHNLGRRGRLELIERCDLLTLGFHSKFLYRSITQGTIPFLL